MTKNAATALQNELDRRAENAAIGGINDKIREAKKARKSAKRTAKLKALRAMKPSGTPEMTALTTKEITEMLAA